MPWDQIIPLKQGRNASRNQSPFQVNDSCDYLRGLHQMLNLLQAICELHAANDIITDIEASYAEIKTMNLLKKNYKFDIVTSLSQDNSAATSNIVMMQNYPGTILMSGQLLRPPPPQSSMILPLPSRGREGHWMAPSQL